MKKGYLTASVLVDVLTVLLVPLNLFFFSVPEWITAVAAVCSAAALVLFYIKGSGGCCSKCLLTLAATFAVVFVLFGSYCNPYWNSVNLKNSSVTKVYDTELSYEEAKADIDFAMHYIKKDHPLFAHGVPAQAEQAYNEVLAELKTAPKIDVTLIHQKLQNIASSLNDAHTCAYEIYEDYRYLKDVYPRTQGGYMLTAVNGKGIAELLRENKDLFSYEVESRGINRLKQQLVTLQGLAYLGISPSDGVSYTWESAAGEETVIYHGEDFVAYEEYVALNHIEQKNEPFVSYEIDKEHSLALLTLTACNYNDEYRECLKDMFAEVRENNIQNVAVDLRDNGGGNSMVATEFIRYLNADNYQTETSVWRLGCFAFAYGNGKVQNKKYSDLTFSGNVYLLTSAGSFSSAMMFAEYIKDNQLGTLIGEAPGNTPSGYGDIAVFSLPNSGLYMQISTKEFFRADAQAEENLITPDIECEASGALEALHRLCD